jgi:hypothetical protein
MLALSEILVARVLVIEKIKKSNYSESHKVRSADL